MFKFLFSGVSSLPHSGNTILQRVYIRGKQIGAQKKVNTEFFSESYRGFYIYLYSHKLRGNRDYIIFNVLSPPVCTELNVLPKFFHVMYLYRWKNVLLKSHTNLSTQSKHTHPTNYKKWKKSLIYLLYQCIHGVISIISN